MSKTLHDKAVAALEARGERCIATNSGKYTVLTREKNMAGQKLVNNRSTSYYVGHAGAVRVGTSARGSLPLTEEAKKILYEEGAAILAPAKTRRGT